MSKHEISILSFVFLMRVFYINVNICREYQAKAYANNEQSNEIKYVLSVYWLM